MLTKYIQAAMNHVEYEQLADRSWFGHVIPLQGVWADATSREECETELQAALEDWLLFRLTNNLPIPQIDGIDLVAAKVA